MSRSVCKCTFRAYGKEFVAEGVGYNYLTAINNAMAKANSDFLRDIKEKDGQWKVIDPTEGRVYTWVEA